MVRRIDVLIPDDIRDHGPERERRRARMIAILSVASIVFPAAFVPAWASEWSPYARATLMGFPVVGALVLVGLRAGLALLVLANVHAAYLYIGCMGLIVRTGGEATASLVALVYLPLMALVLCGRKSGVAWAIAIAVGLGVTSWFVSQGMTGPPDFVDMAWEQNRFSIVAILSLAVAGIGYAFASLQALAVSEADEAWAAIAASEERYRALSENAGDIVADFDASLNLTYISPNCDEILGWPASEMLNQSPDEWFHADDFPKLIDELLHSRRFDETRQMPVRFRHREGHWIPLELSFNSYRDRTGAKHTVAIARDVSELRAAEIAARHHERLASTGTLAAGMAHQINNPVGSILNSSEFGLLSLDDGDLEAVRKALENNVEQARRCGDIVHGLLQFARHEPVKKSREDLAGIVRRGLEMTESYARERGVDLHHDGLQDDLTVEANAIEIEQVVVNVLRNAIEASPRGEGVDVSLRRDDEMIRVEVCDRGRGVDDRDLPHVFDPFFTTRIEDGGNGLGLSVAHGIVSDHGGEMFLGSREGPGTCVRFSLPAAPA